MPLKVLDFDDGELHLNPLLTGIDPAFAWRMLETVERDVFPNLDH